MRRSLSIAFAWSFSAILYWELAWSLAGWPRPAGLAVAIVVGLVAFQWARMTARHDPSGIQPAPVRTERPIVDVRSGERQTSP
jgi:hypothetical protein